MDDYISNRFTEQTTILKWQVHILNKHNSSKAWLILKTVNLVIKNNKVGLGS